MMQLLARCGCLPAPSGGRSVNDAQHRADWKLTPELEPWVDLFPGPSVHPDFPALAALPVPDEHGAAGTVQIALLKCERLADSQSGPPEQHDQRPEAMPLGAVADRAHHGDDLLHRRRVGRILLALLRGGRPRR